jgi:hypothetical protein
MTRFANFLARVSLWLGMILPIITLVFEGLTHACSSTFFDPLPTWWHYLVILPVPVTCFLTWRLWKHPSERAIEQLSVINRIAWPVILLYNVAFAWVSMVACLLLPFSLPMIFSRESAFILLILASLGPLAGFVGLAVSTGSLSRIRAALPAPAAARCIRKGRYGWMVGIALLFIAEGPLLWTEFWIEGAAARGHPAQTTALQILRKTGHEDMLLRQSYEAGSSGIQGPSLALLFGREGVPFSLREVLPGGPVGFNKAREIYFKVTGMPFNEMRPPRTSQFRLLGMSEGIERDDSLDGVDWDAERGGDSVGARVRGLSLATSSMQWHLDSVADQAYGEWTLEFGNAQSSAQEARCQILLPPGGFVSRVNLWIDGELQEAAFGARAQVKAAYRQVVVVEQRDPVMVNMSGPDRVAVQCFPVPPGGRMKIRLGITAPLVGEPDHAGQLAFPAFLERNFAILPGFKHAVSCQRDRGAVEMREADDASLLGERVLPSGDPASLVWAKDPFAANAPGGGQPAYLSRMRESIQQAPAARVVVVVDGSFRLRGHAEVIRKAIEAIPSNLKLEVVMATDGKPLVFGRDALAQQIVPKAFVGGRDNSPALMEGLKQALPSGGEQVPATLIWMLGPQPWAFDRSDVLPPSRETPTRAVAVQSSASYPTELVGYLATLPASPTIHAVEMVPGPNRLLEQLYQSTNLRSGLRWNGTPVGLKAHLASIVGGGERWRYRYARSDTAPQQGVQVWDQLARQQVYDEVMDAFKGVNVVPDAQAKRAAHYQLVTPYSGAVVLETKQQYAAAGLNQADPDSSPKIPSVVPEPSRALLLLVGMGWALLRRRGRCATGGS